MTLYPQQQYPQETYPQDPSMMGQLALLQMIQKQREAQKQAALPQAPTPPAQPAKLPTQQALGLLYPGGFNPNAGFGAQGTLNPGLYQSSITMRGF